LEGSSAGVGRKTRRFFLFTVAGDARVGDDMADEGGSGESIDD
jgi:hypothetical protein